MQGRYLLNGRVAQKCSPVAFAQVNTQDIEGTKALAFPFFEDPRVVPENEEGHEIEIRVGVVKVFLAGHQRLEDTVDILGCRTGSMNQF